MSSHYVKKQTTHFRFSKAEIHKLIVDKCPFTPPYLSPKNIHMSPVSRQSAAGQQAISRRSAVEQYPISCDSLSDFWER